MTPIFILSPTWRSGSTLVQRILNTIPDLTIWGETGGLITRFVEALAAIQRENTLGDGDKERSDFQGGHRNIWVANMNPSRERTLAGMRAMLEHLYSASGRWGFKEVRYGEPEAALLNEMYPESRFIFVFRRPVAALTSYQNADWAGKIPLIEEAGNWVRRSKAFMSFAAKNRARSLIVRHEEIGEAAARCMVTFAGGQFDEKAVREVLALRVGGSIYKGEIQPETRKRIQELCGPLETCIYR